MRRLLALLVVLSAFPAVSHAQIVITEIMYDLAEGPDAGREWVEVLNSGSSAVDLATYRLFENGTNHKISGAGSLAPGGYAVIADNAEKFKADWPSFSSLVFDSAFSLSNTGESISIRTQAGAEIDTVAYSDSLAKGTGDSLQREPGAFFAAGMPTPGAPIPATGLVLAPQKKSAAKSPNVASVSAPTEIRGEAREFMPVSLAAVGVASSSAMWWFAPLTLAFIASIGIVISRRFRADEWEIEEMIEAR